MANISTILLESTTIASAPGGVLISFPYYGDKAKASGYYGQTNPVQTVQYSTTLGFTGVLKLQGTLVDDPAAEDWYDIDGTSLGNGVTPVANQTSIINFDGSHVWVRAAITSMTGGEINGVLLNHN